MAPTLLLVAFAPIYLLQSLHSPISNTGGVVRSAFLKSNDVQRNSLKSITSSKSALQSTARAGAGGADILTTVREGIVEVTGTDKEWIESIAVLSSYIGINAAADDDRSKEEAELLLADGLNWKGWAMTSKMARKYMKPQWPDAAKLTESLEWLTNGPLQLSRDQLSDVIREHPKLYIPNPEETFQKALSVAPEKYQDIDAITALVLRDPAALRLTYNCAQGDEGCGSECGNCWVTYKV